MKTKLAILGLCLTIAFPLLAQKKEDQRLSDSATVMKELSQGDKGLPKSILNQAMCVLIFPSVKKVAVGIGGSYGRGVLVCRKGGKMDGEWGAPVMYALDQGSVGVQLGSTATDFVLVVMNEKGAEQILNGKTKLGGNAAAAAPPRPPPPCGAAGASPAGGWARRLRANRESKTNRSIISASIAMARGSLSEVDWIRSIEPQFSEIVQRPELIEGQNG